MQWSILSQTPNIQVSLVDVMMPFYDFANYGYNGNTPGRGNGASITVLIDDPACADFLKKSGFYLKPFIMPEYRELENPPIFYKLTLYINFDSRIPPEIIQQIGTQEDAPKVLLDGTTIGNLGCSRPGLKTTAFVGEGRDAATGAYTFARVSVLFNSYQKDKNWRELGRDHGVTGYVDTLRLRIKESGRMAFNRMLDGTPEDDLPF